MKIYLYQKAFIGGSVLQQLQIPFRIEASSNEEAWKKAEQKAGSGGNLYVQVPAPPTQPTPYS